MQGPLLSKALRNRIPIFYYFPNFNYVNNGKSLKRANVPECQAFLWRENNIQRVTTLKHLTKFTPLPTPPPIILSCLPNALIVYCSILFSIISAVNASFVVVLYEMIDYHYLEGCYLRVLFKQSLQNK